MSDRYLIRAAAKLAIDDEVNLSLRSRLRMDSQVDGDFNPKCKIAPGMHPSSRRLLSFFKTVFGGVVSTSSLSFLYTDLHPQ